MALTQNPYDILFDRNVNPFVSPRSGSIQRNQITTQPTQPYPGRQTPTVSNPTNSVAGALYRWNDGSYHDTMEPTTGPGSGITATIAPGTTTTTLGGTGGTTTRRFNPDPNARLGQPGYDLFGGYDDIGQLFFNQHPDNAWSHAWSQLAPNAASPWWNWGRQQEGRYEDQWLNEAALPNNAGLTFSDFINRHAPEFRSEFDNLPANQRGVNLFWMPAGRMG